MTAARTGLLRLGQSGLPVSAMGPRGWVIGDPVGAAGGPIRAGEVDEEVTRAPRRAREPGGTFPDTA